jgi:hypothetical protein
MKKIIIAFVFLLTMAQIHAQDKIVSERLQQTLQSYYHIKDALVAGDTKTVSDNATKFIKHLNGISYQLISEGNVHILLKGASHITDAKNIEEQRAAFVNFSSNMAEVVKHIKFSPEPVYLQYCPMKKATWLSQEKNIKNPYYGNAMLTCGKVTETIQ